jgi:hypothetical protein
VENLVYATRDNGVAVAIFGACEGTVKVAGGEEITLIEDTRYPFEEQVRFTLRTARRVAFPLYLRIPSWTKAPSVSINGKVLETEPAPGKYLRIEREWRDGDRVELNFPMNLALREWQVNQNSVSVDYGPLTLSLGIGEEYRRVESIETAIHDSKWQKDADPTEWPSWEIYPTTPWNYSLVLEEGGDPLEYITLERKEWPADNFPFTRDASPLVFRAKGRLIPSWTIDRYGLCGVLPTPEAPRAEQTEDITLVPMGTARLRISSFPKAE